MGPGFWTNNKRYGEFFKCMQQLNGERYTSGYYQTVIVNHYGKLLSTIRFDLE